jgi:hypothetical protein
MPLSSTHHDTSSSPANDQYDSDNPGDQPEDNPGDQPEVNAGIWKRRYHVLQESLNAQTVSKRKAE